MSRKVAKTKEECDQYNKNWLTAFDISQKIYPAEKEIALVYSREAVAALKRQAFIEGYVAAKNYGK